MKSIDQNLLEKACRVNSALMRVPDERKRVGLLERHIAGADVFIAILPGEADNGGLNKIVVKGAAVLGEIMSSGKSRRLAVSAARLAEKEFALGLRMVFGDGRLPDDELAGNDRPAQTQASESRVSHC